MGIWARRFSRRHFTLLQSSFKRFKLSADHRSAGRSLLAQPNRSGTKGSEAASGRSLRYVHLARVSEGSDSKRDSFLKRHAAGYTRVKTSEAVDRSRPFAIGSCNALSERKPVPMVYIVIMSFIFGASDDRRYTLSAQFGGAV